MQGSSKLRYAGPLSPVGPAGRHTLCPHVEPTCTLVHTHSCTRLHAQAPLASGSRLNVLDGPGQTGRKVSPRCPSSGQLLPRDQSQFPFSVRGGRGGCRAPRDFEVAAGVVNVSRHWHSGCPTLRGEGPSAGRLWEGRVADQGHLSPLCGVSPFAYPVWDAGVPTRCSCPFQLPLRFGASAEATQTAGWP